MWNYAPYQLPWQTSTSPGTGATRGRQSIGAANLDDWQFSMAWDSPARAAPSTPQLPLLGGVAQRGTLLAGGLRKSFGAWQVRLGVQQQESMQTGSVRKPAITVLYRPQASGALAGLSLSRASRTPGFFAAGHPYDGRAGAGAEKSQQAELFFANADSSPWRAKLTFFQAYYRDMMDFEQGPPPSLVNRARVYMRGVETSVSRRWRSGAQAYLHAASIDSYDPDSGFDLRYRPRQQATGGFSMPWWGPLHVHASLTWFGPRTDITGVGDELGGSSEAGLMLSWKTRATQAFITVDNLMDRRAEDFQQGWASGRRIRVGWQSRF